MRKKLTAFFTAICLLLPSVGCGNNDRNVTESIVPAESAAISVDDDDDNTEEKEQATLEYWTKGSPAAESIKRFVKAVCDESTDSYLPPDKRIAVFDMDGTLCGERFPTYFDNCLMFHRLVHDDTYAAPADDKAYAQAYENAMYTGGTEPDYDKSSGQILAEAFAGFTVDEYRAYVRDFMKEPAGGFEGMTYGEGFFKPMVSLVEYLAENDFRVYVCSGSERNMVREYTEDTLSDWVLPCNIIGTTFSLTAEQQGNTAGRDYTFAPDDRVLYGGDMLTKNVKMNKVDAIVNEIGEVPVLAFGNSSGDFSMAQYTVQNGGRAYMLLCDDTERDHGDIDTANEFAEKCSALGFETVSMKNEFDTIYGDNVKCVEYQQEKSAPAA